MWGPKNGNGDDFVPRTMSNCFDEQILCDFDLSNKHCSSNCLELRVDQIRERRRSLSRRDIAACQSPSTTLSYSKKPSTVFPELHTSGMGSNLSVVSTSTQATYDLNESTKAFIKFKRNVERTLSTLNDEMSNALRNGVSDINDICYKVRQCLSEIEENDRNYWKVRTVSTPDLIPSIAPGDDLTDKTPLEAFTTPILTQSENQVRIVLEPSHDIPEDEMEDMRIIQERSPIGFTVKHSRAITSFQPGTHQYHDTIPDIFKREAVSLEKTEPCIDNNKPEKEQSCQQKQAGKTVDAKNTKPSTAPVAANAKRAVRDGSCAKQDLDKPPLFYPVEVENEKFESIVTRCKGLYDIHDRLIKQMEACDSLCEFERKMLRKPSQITVQQQTTNPEDSKEHEKCSKCITKKLEDKPQPLPKTQTAPVHKKGSPKRKNQSPRSDISSKYADSLWFATPNTKKSTKERKSKKAKARKLEVTTPRAKESVKTIACKSQCSCCRQCDRKVIVENTAALPVQTIEKSVTQWVRVPFTQLRQCKTLNCIDILDELSFKDVEPIQSEYPRRDNIVLQETYAVEESFLYQMVYGRNNDKILELLSTLNPPRIRCAGVCQINCQQAKRKKEQKTPRRNGGREGENRISRREQKALTKEDVAKKLRPYMTDPNLRYRTTITVMPVKVTVDVSGVLTVTDQADSEKAPKTNYAHRAGDFSRSPKLCDLPNKTKRLTERQLWNKKYAKSVGRHLISFLERQEPLPEDNKDVVKIVELPDDRPKKTYGIPELQRSSPKTPKRPQTKASPAVPSASKAKTKQHMQTKTRKDEKQAIDMKSLTSANHSMLENNIQKIIEMVEFKIVDILSVPERHKSDAFAEVEREIKEVLIRMNQVDDTCEANTKFEKKLLQSLQLTALDTIFDEEEQPVLLKTEDHKSHFLDSRVTEQIQITDESKTGSTPISVNQVLGSDEYTSTTEEKLVTTDSCSAELVTVEKQEQVSDSTVEALEKLSEIADTLQQQMQEHSSTSGDTSTIDLDKYLQKIDNSEGKDAPKATENKETDGKEPDDSSSFHKILQFLDRLTDTYEDSTAETFNYSYTVKKADVLETPVEYYPFTIHHPVSISTISTESYTQTTAKSVNVQDAETEPCGCNVTTKQCLKCADKMVQPDAEHAIMLNMVYSAVFTCIYLAMRLDFVCSLQ